MLFGREKQTNKHNKVVRTHQSASRAGETRGLGDRYLGPERVYIKAATTGGTLGSYFGNQDVGMVQDLGMEQDLGKIHQFNFGGQDMRGLGMLSDNEKKLAAIAVLGIVGWFLFQKQIKKALK
jgi:hypothetical protein